MEQLKKQADHRGKAIGLFFWGVFWGWGLCWGDFRGGPTSASCVDGAL
jgi:hypothetical protein